MLANLKSQRSAAPPGPARLEVEQEGFWQIGQFGGYAGADVVMTGRVVNAGSTQGSWENVVERLRPVPSAAKRVSRNDLFDAVKDVAVLLDEWADAMGLFDQAH